MIDFFKTQKETYLSEFESRLDEFIPNREEIADLLHESLIYVIKNRGKRLRPLIVKGAFELFPSQEDPIPLMFVVESLHTASLIYDDLPCMDDSDFRRAKPACHKEFSESTAVLTSVSLDFLCPYIIAKYYKHIPEIALDIQIKMTEAGGAKGTTSGQLKDLETEKNNIFIETLEEIYLLKTAKLFQGCLIGGYLLSSRSGDDVVALKTLEDAGAALGLAFQITDDILDITSEKEVLGKPSGIDDKNDKITYPSFYSIKDCRKKANEHTERYIELIKSLGSQNTFLIDLGSGMLKRIY